MALRLSCWRHLTLFIAYQLVVQKVVIRYMGKAIGWLIGLLTFSSFAIGVSAFLFSILILAFIGGVIGENDTLLMIYIIGAMATSYLLPIVLAIYLKNAAWLIIIPVITSVVFAILSSFIMLAGCKVGKEEAVWAMRASPIMWLGESIASSENNFPSDCRKSQRLH